jgi:hypothetical protein
VVPDLDRREPDVEVLVPALPLRPLPLPAPLVAEAVLAADDAATPHTLQ